VKNMNADMKQIELTDQELEQVMGGVTPAVGFGFAGGGISIGAPTGILSGGLAFGVGSGNTAGIGFATHQSVGNAFSGLGITNNFAFDNETGFGLGIN
jgi:lactobin A/cerein 7B family class IIb bacteriocin